MSLIKEQLYSEFLTDKDYETNEIDNNKLVVNSKASLPDILNLMLLKENKDDSDAEPIYKKIKTDEILFSSLVTEEQGVASNEQQQLDSKNNVISSDEQKEVDDQNQVDINNEYLQVEKLKEYSYVAPSELELQYDDVEQPMMSNSSQTDSREDDFAKQSFASESYQNRNLDGNTVLNNSRNWFNQDDDVDTKIDPNKIYYHWSMTGETVEINQQETRKFLFANLPGKPDELESPVYEYNPIEEDKKPKQDKKKIHKSHSYGIFDQARQRQANPVGIQEAVSYPQGYLQARYQKKSNYYEQPALNINLPEQGTYNNSVVNQQFQQFDASAIAEHYHSQYPNYTSTNDSCPICYQGG